ncbi:MAG TPA: aminopeptidase [Candidatus Cloacimonadota bacterium]|nr:aminopeptidase [Candidatus Cloacimonadota bacterium]
MSLDYKHIMQQLAAPKTQCDELLQKMRNLQIPSSNKFQEFLNGYRENVMLAWDFGTMIQQDSLLRTSPESLIQENHDNFYMTLHPEQGYPKSLANPDYAHQVYGAELGSLISAILLCSRTIRISIIQHDYLQIQAYLELFFDLLKLAEQGNLEYQSWLDAYTKSVHANQELMTKANMLRRYSPLNDYNRRIVCEADLNDLRYLYCYGVYVDQNHRTMAEFLSKYNPTDLQAIARYIVQCYVDGFERSKRDYRKKRFANVMIPVGMEALGRLVIKELEALGLHALVPTPMSNGINRQYPYDHRFDSALVFTRDFVDSNLKYAEAAMEALKETIGLQAGPVYVELFGETPFSPVSKSTCLKFSDEQQLLYREYSSRNAQLYYKYARRDESSFSIIAFPSTEIGDRFAEIFADTLKINLLDSKQYARIQQHIIDVLDAAEYVHVKGKPGNDTDIRVMMHKMSDPLHQTLFENCVADVNIPVGEVFTSPVLKGTNGTLHVEDIYLGDLRYFNLKIHFEDGWVKDYSCTNFSDPEEGKRYIHENLLLPHQSLPIGEFAIGTNTTAYQIAKKYDIMHLLPILIIEKMGPHFAIGDTCFSHEEEAPHPSFLNGKEMIAVENEKSATRKEDPINAYTNKHMDITLPYEMLQSISAVRADGSSQDIIRNGRFVVPGTEELNIPLQQMN